MGVNITFEGAKIGGKVKALQDAVVGESADISINFNNAEIKKDVDLLSGAEIAKAIAAAEKSLPMDSEEYKALQKLQNNKEINASGVRNAVLNHIASFATGTLANIIAAYVMMK